jgi:hypothetical protein
MQKYDIALKEILRTPASVAATQLVGTRVRRWLDPHLPQAVSPEADLVGETVAGGLIHLEIQSSNDRRMPERMLRYCSGLYWRTGRLPRQILVYVGNERLRMVDRVAGPHFHFAYDMVDIRELDGEKLIESPALGDNVLAILTRLGKQPEALRAIVRRVAGSKTGEQQKAHAQLLALSGLRRLEVDLEKEAREMPITIDLMKNRVIGPRLRQARAEGEAEGRALGEAAGRLALVRDLLRQRFGPIPARSAKKLARLSPEQISDLTAKLFKARSLDELLG